MLMGSLPSSVLESEDGPRSGSHSRLFSGLIVIGTVTIRCTNRSSPHTYNHHFMNEIAATSTETVHQGELPVLSILPSTSNFTWHGLPLCYKDSSILRAHVIHVQQHSHYLRGLRAYLSSPVANKLSLSLLTVCYSAPTIVIVVALESRVPHVH